jgi:hypothetical protein
MTLCGGWSLEKHTASGSRAITLWCRSWTCTDCAPFRIAALKRAAIKGNPTTFITLTVNPQRGQSPEERAAELSNAARIMFKRARRKFRKASIEYLAVFEATKRGEPHLHIIARAPFIPQRWLSDTMGELIAAPIVDIRKVGSQRGVARYVAKYISKGPKPFATLKRYWCTPGFAPPLKRVDDADCPWGSGWRVVKVPLIVLADIWRSHARHVEWSGENEIIAPTGRYPPPWAEKGTGPACVS